MPALSDAKILFIATDGFEDSELLEPRKRLIEAGAEVVLASLETKEIKGDKGATITPDAKVDTVDIDGYDALLLPGGTKNPDKLRMESNVVDLVRRFVESGKPVGAICHAPWLLAEADVIRGRTVTGWPSVRTDLKNAGADVVDREAVTDGNLVTSRNPDDIPAFTEAFSRLVEKAEAPAETV
ncbi:type 1 glutamine amidotransferase domain-containing protein [Sphingosinicella terrae]|jgi:protease I|uniref:type 1 glutamine amidotransferase domain-containing protein n=1 Tax=Sphingosinicella terrae TaxID=2172047 RepID=UPI000E0CE5DC|nr:type 1 glutamine amidotransferase domain-containing protein [Sphingosinicella terrae]